MPIAGADLRSDLGLRSITVDWVVNVYPLGVTAVLLPAGAIGARVGHPRILWTGAWVSALFAALTAAAPDAVWLIAARAGLGVGGGLLFGPLLAILAGGGQGRLRQSISDYATSIGLATGAGPVLAAVLVEAFGWEAVPAASALAALGLAAVLGRVPRRHVAAAPIDLAGSATFAVAVTAAVFACMESSEFGWHSALVLGSCGVAVAFALATVSIERSRPHAILTPRVFADRGFRASLTAVVGVSQSFACVTAFVVPALHAPGTSLVAAAAIGVVPFAAAMALSSSVSRGLRWKASSSLGVGFALQALGLVLVYLAAATAHATLASLPGLVLVGLGIGFANPTVSVLAVSGVDSADTAAAAAINNTMRQLGFAGGVAAFTAISAASVVDAATVRPVALTGAGVSLLVAAHSRLLLKDRPKVTRSEPGRSLSVDDR
jgi:MFS family permease